MRYKVIFILLFTLYLIALDIVWAVDTPVSMETVLNAMAQGGTTSMYGINGASLPQITVSNTDSGGPLIYSDDPEYATADGIMYTAGVAAGTTRIYVYHVNYAGGTKKITVVGQNMGYTTATVTILRRASGFGTAYSQIGKQAVADFLQSTTALTPVTISSNALFVLDTVLDNTGVTYNQLTHGIIEVYASQSVRYTICMLNQSSNTLTTFSSLTNLAQDGYNRRGTFPAMNRTKSLSAVINTTSGMQRISIIRSPTDTQIVGTDAMTYATRTNAGNYGLLYTINIPLRSSNGKDMAILVNPRGGDFGGAFKLSSGITPGGTFFAPSAGSIGSGSTDTATLLGKYALTVSTTTVQLQFITPGGSSLPVELIFAPYTQIVPVQLSLFEAREP
ncbi:MAG: hypothetical protein ACE14V_03345 [bacterium]